MAHNVKLTQFEGPLDLLLHLISKAQVDVSDIFVSEITAQYLEYMSQIEELDMDRASEFIAMAATLVYIKSRSLLPKAAREDEEDPEQVLIRQIREYQIFKKAGQKLNELLLSSGRSFGKLAEEFALPDQVVNIQGASLNELFIAFATIITRQKQNRDPILREVLRDEYTVTDRMEFVRDQLRFKSNIQFADLFMDDISPSVLIATFMAVLELLASGDLKIMQSTAFSEITLLSREARIGA